MTSFNARIGDLFTSKAQTLVNTVNCVGVMGKGIALEFKRRFPAMYDDYVERCRRKAVKVGEPYLYEDTVSGTKILNFPTKDHWRSASRLSDIERGLDELASHHARWGIRSIAMPPLGCGNGGLAWSEVGPLIRRKLANVPFDVEVYAPFGTPSSELEASFLDAPVQMALDRAGAPPVPMNPEWAVLVEVLHRLESQPHAPPVGRVIFQKVCYVLTQLGVPTGFGFGKGSYGPFSADVKPALHAFANRNWVHEAPFGRMVRLRVGERFLQERGRFADDIERHRKTIDKTVDLFSRIKDTEQAEEVLTVLFACRQVKKGDPTIAADEQQVLDYILDWKKSWSEPVKRAAVASAIRNLAALGWIRVTLSASLPVE
jgi:O-acetyl-ADP-ribose deacetylase (regulator of RNase III)/uncharacterized protein YwgA